MKRLLLLLLLPLATSAQKKYTPLLDSFMQAEVAVKKFNGNVLVAKDGKVLYQKAFGYTNYDTKELLNNNSVFELASIAKQFTAMGILLLNEKGLIKLSDTLRKFFPELSYSNITIQNLLTHTSGLPEYEVFMEKYWNHNKIAFNKDVINILAAEKPPLNFKPGEKWEYSNTAYIILASIIEKISGLSFKDYLQKNIFDPLNMEHTREYNTRRSLKEIIPNFAYGYVYSDSLKRYMLPDSLPEYNFVVYLDGMQGDGTIISTTGDLLKWDRAIKNHILLGEATQNEMLSPQSIMDTVSKKYYGYGVVLGKNEIGDYIMHGGEWPGVQTMLFRYLKDDLTIIVLSNNESNSTMLAGALAYIVTDRPVILPYFHKVTSIDETLLDNYVGKYSIPNVPNPTQIEIFKKDGKLLCRFEKDMKGIELKPESDRKFFIDKDFDMQIEFEADELGQPTKSYFIISSMKKEMAKLN